MSFLEFRLNIYPETLDRAYDIAQETLEEVLLSDKLDELDDKIDNYFEEEGVILLDNATDRIIEIIFEKTLDIINDFYGNVLEIETYVNGDDSHIYLRNDEIFNEHLSTSDRKLIKKVYNSCLISWLETDEIAELFRDKVIADILDAVDYELGLDFYEDKEELGDDIMIEKGIEDGDSVSIANKVMEESENEEFYEFSNGKIARYKKL